MDGLESVAVACVQGSLRHITKARHTNGRCMCHTSWRCVWGRGGGEVCHTGSPTGQSEPQSPREHILIQKNQKQVGGALWRGGGGIAKGSSLSWVAQLQGDKDGECKAAEIQSEKVVPKLQGEGQDESASLSSREPFDPWISVPFCAS